MNLATLNEQAETLSAQVTRVVGTWQCVLIFCVIALLGQVPHWTAFIAWLSSNFLQLVLLPLIMVGTNYLNKSNEQRSEDDHQTLKAEWQELKALSVDSAQEILALRALNDTQLQELYRLQHIEHLLVSWLRLQYPTLLKDIYGEQSDPTSQSPPRDAAGAD